MKVLKKLIASLIFITIGFIAGVIYETHGKIPEIEDPINVVKEKSPDKCDVTWIAAVAKSQPTTFWTLQTSECLSRFGYIHTRELDKIEEFKTELTTQLKDEIYSKTVDDVTYRLENLNYIVAHVAEKECSKNYLENKLKKLDEYVDVCLETHDCLDKDMLSDLENFVKEYK
jgi:hypothetical protein